MRKNFVTYNGKSTVISACDEFLEMPKNLHFQERSPIMPKKPSSSIPLILSALAVLLMIGALLLTSLTSAYLPTATESTAVEKLSCVVIDAGHGGEDCGAISASGLYEKDANLAVAFALRDLLEMNGVPVVMTRDEDILLYDREVDYQGRKKVLDLAARKTIADNSGDCLFVSIHMNAFPQTQYSGTQVWYGTKDPRSQAIASDIQKAALTLQPANTRKIKAAGSNIYLLDNIGAPCVLVECGFLSNPEEAARLSDQNYRQALAFMIFSGISPYLTASDA